jgi:oligopeptide/dipeptide ABC transporter ATP-binding protein
MYAGHVMEYGDIADVFERPANPYTRELLRATESVEGGVGNLYSIPGAVPDLRHVPPGCLFRPRCPSAADECADMPASIEVSAGHWSKCHFASRLQRQEAPVRPHGIPITG